MKFYRRQNKNRQIEAFSWTFLVGVVLFITIFSTNFASAIDWNDKLIAYYDFNDSSEKLGTGWDLVTGDGTGGTFETTGCLIGKCGNVTSGNNWNITDVGTVFDFAGVGDMAISFWLNGTNAGVPFNKFDFGTNDGWLIRNSSEAFVMNLDATTGSFGSDTSKESTTGRWAHYVIVRNVTGYTFYTNGTVTGTRASTAITDNSKNLRIGNQGSETVGDYQGAYDELSLWNRSLTQTDIDDLYNGGSGQTYGVQQNITITLRYPTAGLQTNNDPIFFNATLDTLGFLNLTNGTVYIWNSSDDEWQTNTSTIVSTNSTTNISVSISDWVQDTYLWNVYSCYENATDGTFYGCGWAENNISFGWVPFSVNLENHTWEVYETSSQRFLINITTLSNILSVSANLVYNGTNYTSDVSCTEENCTIQNTIDVPLVQVGDSANRTFYWDVKTFDGSSSTTFTTSNYSQNTTKIHLEACGDYTVEALNFTAYNEENITRMDNFNFYGFFEYWLGSGDVKQNTTIDNANVTNVSICMSPENRTMQLDAQIDYGYKDTNTTFPERNYYYQNATLTNSSSNVSLYLLESSVSTTFIHEVEDQQSSVVEGALVYIQRFYPEDGIYRTVQISKTDANGKSAGYYQVDTVDYKHIISLDGETVLETSRGKIVRESTPYTLIFRIGGAILHPWSYLEENPNIQTTLTFNETTNITTFSWVDSTGTTTLGRLLVYQQKHDRDDLLICNVSASFSSATITCDTTGYDGNFKAYGYLASSPESFTDIINFLVGTAKDIFGNTGLIIGWFIILTASLAFIWNPTAMIVVHNISTIFVNVIGFISFGLTYIFAMIAVSIILIIFLKT